MSEPRRLAVIIVRNDTSVAPLGIEEAKRLVLTDQNSLVRYWRENAENWFTFSPLDFFGSYDVILPAPPDSRYTVLNAATAAAKNAGVNVSSYDGIIVLLHPGKLADVGYDAGATGIGPGASCVLPTKDNHTFFCHETGHILGFDHTFGIMNAGADWNGDGITQLFPDYGDPYDLMSSAPFGGATPTFSLPANPALGNFPNALSAGPMLSRANLHFSKPAALEATNKVRHVFEGAPNEGFTLYPAGQGDAGKPELVIFHPANEDASARGRVYVEYRQPFDFNWASRWDGGLAANGKDRDNRGVVVHVVKGIPGSSATAVWYAGRLVFPGPDCDLKIDTPQGSVTVTVADEFVQQKTPAFVRVHVNRQNIARVSIEEGVDEKVTVLSTERRPIPGWEWAGLFAWERRQSIRTVTYAPIVAGRGGAGPIEGTSNVRVHWYLGGFQPGPEAGMVAVLPQEGGPYVNVNFSIDPLTRTLSLWNEPGTAGYTIGVQASASDEATWREPIKADTVYWADGVTEGWGDDYKRFMDLWDRITHPIPKRHFGPPVPDDYRVGIDRLIHVYDALRQASPEVATNLQPLVVDQMRFLQRMAMQQ